MIFPLIHNIDMVLSQEWTPGISPMTVVMFALATPTQFWLGWEYYVKSFKSLRSLHPSMDVLIAIGTSAAYFYSIISIIVRIVTKVSKVEMFFETSVMLIAFMLLGRMLETLAKGRTSRAVSELMRLQAPSAIVVEIDAKTGDILNESTIDVNMLEQGDICKIVPGSTIPADGLLLFLIELMPFY